MQKKHSRKSGRRWTAILTTAAIGAGLAWGFATEHRGQSNTPLAVSDTRSVFTPAHRTVGEAVRHFFGWRDEPVQPIPYTHQVHVQEVGLECNYCHNGVEVWPVATFPSINTCMECHFDVATDRPSIQMLTSYYERGEEPPWQRVYGWPEEAHVRFNHAPHTRAGVECATCHGDVAQMTVAERVVEHTMGFCVNCHEQEQASNDCLVCHY